MNIKPLEIKDYDAVLALWQSCEGIGLSAADEKPRIAVYLERNPGCSFVARVEGQIVGAVLGGHDGRRGFLHHLAVRPDQRRLGIGRLLAQASLDALAQQGIDRVHIFVYADNSSGIAFWEQIGWRLRRNLVLMSFDLQSEASPSSC
ncbi:MAG: GNAT family N-acetyltransferase [Chloroflexota bacterium]